MWISILLILLAIIGCYIFHCSLTYLLFLILSFYLTSACVSWSKIYDSAFIKVQMSLKLINKLATKIKLYERKHSYQTSENVFLWNSYVFKSTLLKAYLLFNLYQSREPCYRPWVPNGWQEFLKQKIIKKKLTFQLKPLTSFTSYINTIHKTFLL